MYRTLVIAVIGIIGALPASAKPQAAIPAFPGAEGGGMYTPGPSMPMSNGAPLSDMTLSRTATRVAFTSMPIGKS